MPSRRAKRKFIDHLEKNSSSRRGRSESTFECPLHLQWSSISIGKKGLLNLQAHVGLALSRWKQFITGNELLLATGLMNDDVRAAEHNLGSSNWHWTLFKIWWWSDGDATSLRYGSTLCFKRDWAHCRRQGNDMFMRFDKIRWRLNMLRRLSLSHKHITTQGENLTCF